MSIGDHARSPLRRVLSRWLAAALIGCAAGGLAGCSSTSVIDNIPASVGGLAEDTPQRPAEPVAFPAVHDMPPPREAGTLTDLERQKLEADLVSARTRQETQTGTLPKDQKKAAAKGKKPASTAATAATGTAARP